MLFIVNPGAAAQPLASTELGDSPYLHDPANALAVSETATTLAQALEANKSYPSIQVADSSKFPDARGYLVIGLGYDYQVGPVPYVGVGSSSQLLLDPAFVIPVAVPPGAAVNLAERLSDDEVPHGDGDFWLTPSPAGRAACETNVDDIAAGGREVAKTVTYPNDIGLAGSGLPTKGAPRLSGAVEVWAADDPDAEVAAARSA